MVLEVRVRTEESTEGAEEETEADETDIQSAMCLDAEDLSCCCWRDGWGWGCGCTGLLLMTIGSFISCRPCKS